MTGFGAGPGFGGQGFGPGSQGPGRDPREEQEGDSAPSWIKDHRKVDPVTGKAREPQGGASPFPGAGGPSSRDPKDPANAAQPLSVDQSTLLAAELDLARQEVAERTADLQRVTAEYANYRKRVDRDREVVTATAKASVLTEMLPVLDDLDRARAHGDLVGSFGAVADKLAAVLTKQGLTPVGAVGEHFDPAVHEAVQFGTSTEVTEPTVTTVFRAGYRLGERLVRPAVVVVTGPEHDSAASEPPADAPSAASPTADAAVGESATGGDAAGGESDAGGAPRSG